MHVSVCATCHRYVYGILFKTSPKSLGQLLSIKTHIQSNSCTMFTKCPTDTDVVLRSPHQRDHMTAKTRRNRTSSPLAVISTIERGEMARVAALFFGHHL